LKGSIVELIKHIQIKKYKFNPITEKNKSLFDCNSAELFINKIAIGTIGSINTNILTKYEIDFPVYLAAIDITTLSEIDIPNPHFSPISLYPIVKRDLAFIIDKKYNSKELKKLIFEKATSLLRSVIIFDVYTGKNIDNNKRSIGFELTFAASDRTLTDKEIEKEIEGIVAAIEKNYDAELRKLH